MFQFFNFNKRVFLLVSALFLSSTISSFNPLEPLLWPDPDFKTKLSFTKFLSFKKPKGAQEFQGTLEGSLESSMVPVEYKFKIIEDVFAINKNFKPLSKLPALSLSFSIKDSKFIPDSSALRATQNFLWDIQYGVGDVWYDDFGNIRTSFPFSLIQKN